ncbi:MAG: cytochrome P450 [Synechococcaceae cyanobacterium ELA182]
MLSFPLNILNLPLNGLLALGLLLARLRQALVGVVLLLAALPVALLRPQPRLGPGERLAALLARPDSQRWVSALLRAFAPNLRLPLRLRAYPCTSIVLVSRAEDVREVLARQDSFAVVYGPRMEAVTGGHNFLLGMQDGPAYSRDVATMRLAFRREDGPTLLSPLVAAEAAAIVADCAGQIDLAQHLALPVACAVVERYFGTPGLDRSRLIEWTSLLFWYIFVDLFADPALETRALAAASRTCAWLDQLIAERKAHPTGADDVLNRCLAMQGSGHPGLDDLAIRNNLIGFLVGGVAPLAQAACQMVDVLLDRPAALAIAQRAAREGDDRLLDGCLFEALRFAPGDPLIYRRALENTTIARGSLRACRVPRGAMVLALNGTAMFDPAAVRRPGAFRPDRPWQEYLHWGYGLHSCAGAYLNRAVLPAMLKPLLAQPGLGRAEGERGRIDRADTPFVSHLHLVFASD